MLAVLLIALYALPTSSADPAPLPYNLNPNFYRDWVYQTVNQILDNRYGVRLKPLRSDLATPSIYVVSQAFLDQCVPKAPSRKNTKRVIPAAFFPDSNEILIAREHLSRQMRLIVHEFTHYILYLYSKIDLGERWEEDLAEEVEKLFIKQITPDLPKKQEGQEGRKERNKKNPRERR